MFLWEDTKNKKKIKVDSKLGDNRAETIYFFLFKIETQQV